MAALVPIAWPASLPGCCSGWGEKAQPVVVRSNFEGGLPKVRRRFTAVVRSVDVSMTLAFDQFEILRDYFDVDLQGGVKPFNFVHPYLRTTKVFRMTEAPQLTNQSALAVDVGMKWEELP